MKGCWPEGDLRAYHDGELPPAEMDLVAAHLRVCVRCETLADEIAGRAMRVSHWISSLPEPDQLVWMPRHQMKRVRRWPRWAAAAATLAAGAALAFWVMPHGQVSPARVPVIPPAQVSLNPVVHELESRVPETRPMRPRVKRGTINPRRETPERDVFLSLDDEPIETGVVVRVALGDAGVPADVVFGKDGRPRAIRLVSNHSNF
jgi:hypothetical protein